MAHLTVIGTGQELSILSLVHKLRVQWGGGDMGKRRSEEHVCGCMCMIIPYMCVIGVCDMCANLCREDVPTVTCGVLRGLTHPICIPDDGTQVI